ncbi:MAG: hypothetical protein V5A43_06935, partial [Haloarculaceae archaeon]
RFGLARLVAHRFGLARLVAHRFGLARLVSRGPRLLALLLVLAVLASGLGTPLVASAGITTSQSTTAETMRPHVSLATASGMWSVTRAAAVRSPAASPPAAVTPVTNPRATSEDAIEISTQLSLTPAEPGSIEVRTEFAIPDNVVALTARLEDDATVLETRGLSPTGEGEVEWDGETRPATVTYEMPANETGRVVGPEGAGGDLLLADVGDWAIAERPSVGVQYRYRGSVTVTRTTALEGQGVVGTGLAYLGPHHETTHRAHDQQFRLVVPQAADLRPSEAAIFDSLAGASDALRVGERDETVLAIVAPTSVDWGVEGLQIGDADFYVQADEPLDVPGNTWLHEYVHTRGNHSLASDARWLQEATATYFAALLTLEQERMDFETFREALDRGTRSRYEDVVLAEESTWTDAAQYVKGALVAGELDRRLRLATDSGTTLQTVFSQMNNDPDYDARDLLAVLETHGGDGLRAAGRAYTGTSEAPAPWTRGEHEEAFGQLPARVEVRLPAAENASAWRVSGPYRNGTVEPQTDRIVPGETVRVDIPVTNAGGTEGSYEFAVRLDGVTVATRTGTAPANAIRWEAVPVAPETVGSHTLVVAGERATISAAEPASLQTGALRVEPARVAPGGSVDVSVAVENPDSLPGEGVIAVEVDGARVESRTVRLGPGAETTLEFELRFEEAGEHRVAVGGESVTVTVGDANGSGRTAGTGTSPGNGAGGTTDGGGSGFGAGVAAAALLLLALLGGFGALRRWPRQR